MADYKQKPDEFAAPLEEESGLVIERDWTDEEEKKAKRKWVSRYLIAIEDWILITSLLGWISLSCQF